MPALCENSGGPALGWFGRGSKVMLDACRPLYGKIGQSNEKIFCSVIFDKTYKIQSGIQETLLSQVSHDTDPHRRFFFGSHIEQTVP